jgi:hypothetical protein
MRYVFILFSFIFPFSLHAQPFEIKRLSAPTVGRYETIELGIKVPAFDRLLRNYVTYGIPSRNPYLASDIAIQVAFSNGKTHYIVDAFYYEDPAPIKTLNVLQTSFSKWPFRVRFCPPDTGLWMASVLLGDPSGERMPMPTEIEIRCVAGKNSGWLKAKQGQRLLTFENKNPFFAIGQNIAWADMPVLRGKQGPSPVYSAGYYDIFDYMHNLGANGGNFMRVVLVPWTMSIEWEEAGRYNQMHAAVLDSILRIAEQRGIYMLLCIEMHTNFQENFDENYSWKKNPYRKFLPANARPSDFLVNDSCRFMFKQKLRYMLARWGHSPNLAVIELMSEMNGWSDYKGNEQRFIDWHVEMCRFIREDLNDNRHLLSSCFSTPPLGSIFGIDGLQLTSLHPYGNNYNVNESRWIDINGRHPIREQRGVWRRWEKPFLFTETGMINGPVNAADPNDYEHCNDVSFHTALWSSALSGGYGSGLLWWQWHNDAYRKNNFPALRWFTDSVLLKINWNPEKTVYAFDKNDEFACYYQVVNKTKACGWLHNRSWWWQNVTDSCQDRSGKKMLPPRDNDKLELVNDYTGKTIVVGGFEKRNLYRIFYYDTRVAGKIIKKEEVKTGLNGTLTLTMPTKFDCAWKASKVIAPIF